MCFVGLFLVGIWDTEESMFVFQMKIQVPKNVPFTG